MKSVRRQSNSLIVLQSPCEMRWGIWSRGLLWHPALFVFFAHWGFPSSPPLPRPPLQFRFMEMPPNRKLLSQDDRQRWWDVRRIATGGGPAWEDHTSGSNLQFNRRRTWGLLVMSADWIERKRKWDNLCTSAQDLCLRASVYTCEFLWLSICSRLCSYKSARGNVRSPVCWEGGDGCGRGKPVSLE